MLINSPCLSTLHTCQRLEPHCIFGKITRFLSIRKAKWDFADLLSVILCPCLCLPPPPPPRPLRLINSYCLFTINDCKRLDPYESLTKLPVSCRFVKQNEPLPIYFLSYYVHVSALFFFFFFCWLIPIVCWLLVTVSVLTHCIFGKIRENCLFHGFIKQNEPFCGSACCHILSVFLLSFSSSFSAD